MGKLITFQDGSMGISYIDNTARNAYVAFFDSDGNHIAGSPYLVSNINYFSKIVNCKVNENALMVYFFGDDSSTK